MLSANRARLVCESWTEFHSLYKAMQKADTDPDQFSQAAQKWKALFLTAAQGRPNTSTFISGLYRPNDLTPYIHVLVYHVSEFMQQHRTFGFSSFSCGPVEK